MRWFSLLRRPCWLAGASPVLVCAGVVAVGLVGQPSGGSTTTQLDTLHARCVQDMVANTCKVMGTGSISNTAKAGDLVFVAGIGPIDAVAYQQMYAAGDAMCNVVRIACAQDWNEQQCRTARNLWTPE